MSEENTTKQNYNRTVSLSNDKPESKQYSITMRNSIFWTALIAICVVIGIIIGVLAFESRIVLHFTNEAIQTRNDYAELQRAHDRLKLENDNLQAEVQVLTDTLQAKVLLEEQKAKEEAEKKIPDGFPVTGTVAKAEMSEYDSELDMAAYYTASVDSVIVATAEGQVLSVRQTAYEFYEVQVDHGNGYVSIYTNKVKPIIEEGSNVTAGTPLYYVGEDNTFLKYQITYNGALVNVYDVMQIAG